MDIVDNKDRYFKGQQSNEVIICFVRHHWIYILKEFLYFTIFLTIISLTLSNFQIIKEVLQGNRELKMLFLAGFCILTYFLHRFFIKLLNFFVNTGIVTDHRFIDHQKTLFFKDTMDSIDMTQIQNIERIGDGLLPNLLGYGDIKIFLSASASVKTYNCIPNIKFHYRCLTRLKEARQQMLYATRDQNPTSIREIAGKENAKIFKYTAEPNAAARPIPFEPIGRSK